MATGNWPGKTVTNAQGRHHRMGRDYIIVDLPGTYSLIAHSAEEEVARDFICFGGADVTAVVCDATCLERNLNLVLQTIEITPNVVVCVNLCDEAQKKNIRLDLAALERNLGVPVVGTSARSEKGLDELMARLCAVMDDHPSEAICTRYTEPIERAVDIVEAAIRQSGDYGVSARWLALRLIDGDESLGKSLFRWVGRNPGEDMKIVAAVAAAWKGLQEEGYARETIRDRIVSCIVLRAEEACSDVVFSEKEESGKFDRKLDRILTSRITGIPIMIALLCVVFWLTITGANYPSQLLSSGLFWIQDRLTDFFTWMGAPAWLHGAAVLGIYRTLAWVIVPFRDPPKGL